MYQIFFKFLKHLLFLSVIVLVNFSAKAQNNRVLDSLQSLLDTKKGIARFDVLYELAFENISLNNFQQSISYLESAQEIAFDFGDSIKIVKSKRVKAQMLRRLGKTNEAILEFQQILPIARRNGFSDEHEYILNSLAIAYTFQADYDKALEYHFQALLVREKDGDHREITETLNNIGLVYFKLKNYERALEYYYKALDHDNKVKKSDFKDQLLINIGLCYNQLKSFAEAQKLINQGIEYCSPSCNEFTLLFGEFGLGVSFYGLEDYVEADKHFQKSLDLSRKTNNKRFLLENLIYLGKVYTKTLKESEAKNFLKEAETTALNTEYKQLLLDIYKAYSVLYNEKRDFENAALYQQKFISLNDSVYGEELIKNVAKVQTQFEERQNLATIAAKEEVIQRQRSLNFAIIIIAILASLLIFVLYRSNRVKRKVNQALSDAKAIIEDQNRQLLSSNYSLDRELKEKNNELEKANESLQRVNEELDNFIYKTSHDIRGPLASLKGMCNVALMDVKDKLALSYLRKLDITAEKLNTILTRLLIVNQINNSTLGTERIDFVGIVNDVLMLEKKKGLPSRLKVKKHIDDSIEFYSDKEFVRIILENLIDNAIKFYNDSDRIEPFVDISVTEQDQQIKIKVVDNGIGISEVHPDKIFQMFSRASERSETGGIGLYITKTATEKLGGHVHLKTTPEGFTEFFVTIPLTPARIMA